jgi:hypothetical protein
MWLNYIKIASMETEILDFNDLDIGQFSFASFAHASNFSFEIPGILALTAK